MQYVNERLVQLNADKWFIETRTGYDGPFEDEQEAKRYLDLLRSCEAARVEFAGLAFSPQ